MRQLARSVYWSERGSWAPTDDPSPVLATVVMDGASFRMGSADRSTVANILSFDTGAEMKRLNLILRRSLC